MNNFKKTGGFTLVELIVVIAILGILAAVAIPAYSGYITKAQDASVITKLDAVATAAQAANAAKGAITEITVEHNSTITVEANDGIAKDFDDNFKMFYSTAATFEPAEIADNTTTITISGVGIDLGKGAYKDEAVWTAAAGAWS